MKQEIEDNRKKIETQNEKISDLLYKSQKYDYFMKSHMTDTDSNKFN